jgi:tRNA-modifying protein YgfZ
MRFAMNHAAMADTTFCLPLPHLALIAVRGADAEAFLQGQFSNDVRRLTATQAQLSSYNSPKGRMLAVLHLLRDGDTLLVEVQRPILDPVLRRLRLHVLRSKVTLAEAADRAVFGVAGAEAPVVLSQLALPAPTAPLEVAWEDGCAVVRRIGPVPRYTLVLPAARSAAVARRIAALAREGAPEEWRLAEIEAGVPTVYPETQDHFVPQMCNLDALGGIAFDKGCYTGQEIVARVHYRGAVKRRMSRVELAGAPPAPGTKLEAGEVVDAAPRPEGGSLALVVSAN